MVSITRISTIRNRKNRGAFRTPVCVSGFQKDRFDIQFLKERSCFG